MSDDILDRAKTCQREHATSTTLSIRLAFMQDLIAEIERLRALVREATPTIAEITRKLEAKS